MLPMLADIKNITEWVAHKLRKKMDGVFHNDDRSIDWETDDGDYIENFVIFEDGNIVRRGNDNKVEVTLNAGDSKETLKTFDLVDDDLDDIYDFIESYIEKLSRPDDALLKEAFMAGYKAARKLN